MFEKTFALFTLEDANALADSRPLKTREFAREILQQFVGASNVAISIEDDGVSSITVWDGDEPVGGGYFRL